tara:strand:- start:1128 stop:1271 length:144 start_codon:yes stop_codon:yes gene_type:complete
MLVKIFGLADLLAAFFLFYVSFDSAFLNIILKSIMIIHLYKGLISFV